MGRQLTANVVVRHPETGAPEVLEEGSDLPDWASDLVGDHALSGKSDKDSGDKAGSSPEPKKAGPPPTHGKGSGRDAWAEYAASHRVEVSDGMSREDIVEACRAAGVPVE